MPAQGVNNRQPAVAPPMGDLIVFDGLCVLCNGFARFVHRFDRRSGFGFATAQSPVGQRAYQQLGLSPDDLQTFLVWRQGQGYVKSSAVLAVLTGFGGLWPIFGIGWVVPRPIRDWLYDRVARNRYRLFGRHDSCPLPPPGLAARFVPDGLSQ